MKKNLYYRTVFKRTNLLKEFFYSIFFGLCSWPRFLLEVFIRKNFGERYFSLFVASVLSIFLAFYPLIRDKGLRLSYRFGEFHLHSNIETSKFLLHNATWYLFLIAFIYMCIVRYNEIKHLPSVFDFERFSLSSGNIHPFFLNFQWRGENVSVRTIETLLEPAFFFLIGFVLYLFGQSIGVLILVCSIFYSFGYLAMYHQGDEFIMDKIDERIYNEELMGVFVDEKDSDSARGISFYGRRPSDPETRRKIAENILEEAKDEIGEAI